MMEARTVKHLVEALVLMFLCAAPHALAAMYKWTDADGSVTYSNQPPIEPDKVRDLTPMEDITTTPAEMWPSETPKFAQENPSAGSAVASPKPSGLQGEPARAERSLVRPQSSILEPQPMLVRPEPALPKSEPALSSTEPTLKPESATLSPDGGVVRREAEDGPRTAPRGEKEAARDPCLRSSDPNCYERHKDRYHPYFGYAPGVTQAGSALAVGGTSAAAAGGSIGGQSGPPPTNVTPGRVESPLIFFDSPPTKKRRGK